MLPESRATLHLIQHLDSHDVHADELIAHLIFLRSAEQEWHDQVQVIIEDLYLELGQEKDCFLCDLNVILS